MTDPAPETVAPGNGPVAGGNLPEIDYDKLAQSLKSVLPQSPAVPAPVAPSNNGYATKEEIDALPEKMVNAFREAFTPAAPPATEQPPPAEEPKTPGKRTFSEWWGGVR